MKRVWLFLGLLVVMVALGVIVTRPVPVQERPAAAAQPAATF